MAELARRLGGERVEGPAPPAEPEAAGQGAPLAEAVRLDDEDAALVSRHARHPRLGPIVERFVQQLPPRLEEMRTAADKDDHAELARLAHWLKGAGGSMGFDDLFEPSRRLEEAAKAGDGPAARSIMDELGQLERRIRRGAASAETA
jgi:HPt (histidine-containing phosphotransfer) domain-containing protein